MENNTNTTPNQEENILDSLKEKAAEFKEMASTKFEEMQEKAEDLLEQAKSSEFVEDAKDKMSDLVEEAKGIWNKVIGTEEKAVETNEESEEFPNDTDDTLDKSASK